ncbi:hypothetical protein L6164_019071 [Bauhinia variegata]|uniref:Uncharacterized protein n=1 Tax=Bauhinia variegata TaxID=167791 RepID=A0ACB9NDP9_BAUVA|nr:hypothetical protein L6164_019071 [Bauhinia variegata]
MKVSQVFFYSLFAVFVLFTCPARSAKEVEDESEFNYEEGSDKGPSRWGYIRPDWHDCKNGKMQSPIDLLNKRVEIVPHLGLTHTKYHPSNATIRNRGHDIILEWADGAGYLVINGTNYVLQQCHWHSPSEHSIDGKRFDLELHMVHESSAGETVVIGIMYKIGKPDPFLSSLTDHLRAISDTTDAERVVSTVDPNDIKIRSIHNPHYKYIGSLTIPPCTENVVWNIARKVRTVSKEQVRLLRVAVHDESDTNARPLQPTNNRLVQLYKPKDPEED